MIRIGYAPGAFDLFHIGHLNLLRRAKERCDYLIAGVVSDEVLIAHKGVTPVVPLAEYRDRTQLPLCRRGACGDDGRQARDLWRDLRFNAFFKGDDWQDTEKGARSSGNSPKSASRAPIFHIRRRHPAVGCAGPCRT
jgi:glycerol-3-phosphate cytidylyltransferase